MSFVKRNLVFQIQLQGDTFSSGANTLSLQGIRSRATIQSVIGGDTAFGGMAVVQIWGMKPEDMAKLSTLGLSAGIFTKNLISIQAGDQASDNYSEVFSGGIFSARINYNAMPDVSLELICYATINEQMQSIPGTSAAGSSNVAAMLQGICASCSPPLNFINNGVTAVLANHAVGGSPAQQIKDICLAAGICYVMQPAGTLTIWPRDKNRDGTIISISPETGMVGYPEYREYGIDVAMLFNPEVEVGRQITIQTSIPPPGKSNPPIPGLPGTFYINTVAHDLSAELPGGPWFTHATVGSVQIVGRW
jgi:hypothetical protein